MDRTAWGHQQTGFLVGDEKDVSLSSPTPPASWETMGLGRTGWEWCEGRGGTPETPSLPVSGIQGVTMCLILPQLTATDADEGEFGRVWYRILHGEWVDLGCRGGGRALLPGG